MNYQSLQLIASIIGLSNIVASFSMITQGVDVLFAMMFTLIGVFFCVLAYFFGKHIKAEAQDAAQGDLSSKNTLGISKEDSQTDYFDTVRYYLLRSNNFVESLLDLESHAKKDDAALGELLSRIRSSIENLKSESVLGMRYLGKNRRWWIAANFDENEDAYDAAMSVEAALNVWSDIYADSALRKNSVQDAINMVFSQVSTLGKKVRNSEDSSFYAKDIPNDGEWGFRSQFVNYLECLPAPFRMTYIFRSNVKLGSACINLEIPRAISFAPLFDSDNFSNTEPQAYIPSQECAKQQALYAYRLSLAVAKGAFQVQPQMKFLFVNCVEHGTTDPFFSLALGYDEIDSLLASACSDAVYEGMQDSSECMLGPVESGHIAPLDRPFSSPTMDVFDVANPQYVELDESVASARIKTTCGATHVCDLGVNESAARYQAFSDLYSDEDEQKTTAELVSKLVGLRDSTPNTSVAQAADRLCEALIQGELDTGDKDQAFDIFVNGDALSQTLSEISKLLSGDDITEEALERARSLGQKQIDLCNELDQYRDDSETIYRYFGSTTERIWFNKNFDTEGKALSLVPDDYHNLHRALFRINDMLDNHEEASRYAEAIVHMAPVSPEAALLMAHFLEDSSHLYGAADVLKKAIEYTVFPPMLATLYYRLAFLEWKLGNIAVVPACYKYAMSINQEVVENSLSELKEFFKEQPDVKEPSLEESKKILTENGISLGDIAQKKEVICKAAAACIDEFHFSYASSLMGQLFEFDHDDVIAGVINSLH